MHECVYMSSVCVCVRVCVCVCLCVNGECAHAHGGLEAVNSCTCKSMDTYVYEATIISNAAVPF